MSIANVLFLVPHNSDFEYGGLKNTVIEHHKNNRYMLTMTASSNMHGYSSIATITVVKL